MQYYAEDIEHHSVAVDEPADTVQPDAQNTDVLPGLCNQ